MMNFKLFLLAPMQDNAVAVAVTAIKSPFEKLAWTEAEFAIFGTLIGMVLIVMVFLLIVVIFRVGGSTTRTQNFSEQAIKMQTTIIKHYENQYNSNERNNELIKDISKKTQTINQILASQPDKKIMFNIQQQMEKQALYLHDEFAASHQKLDLLANESSVKQDFATQESLAQIREQLSALQNITSNAKTDDIAQNVTQIREQLSALQNITSNAKTDDIAQNVTQIREQLSALQNITSNAKTDDIAQNVTQIREQLSALQNQSEKLKPELTEKIHERLNALSNKLDAADNSSLSNMLSQSMNRIVSEIDAKFALLNKLEQNIETRWADAITSIHAINNQIGELSTIGEQIKDINRNLLSMSSHLMLSHFGDNEPSGRQQLAELLDQALPSEYYTLDTTLPNGHLATALIRFPDTKDSVAIDADLPMQLFFESLNEQLSMQERDNRNQMFAQTLTTRVNDVANHLIAPSHTSESAILFIPSEAAFADIHSRHQEVVNLALARHVWLASPTTLLAVVNTVNIAIKGHEARSQLHKMQENILRVIKEAQSFENRLTEIGEQVDSTWRDTQHAETPNKQPLENSRNIPQRQPTYSNDFSPPPLDQDDITP